MSLLISGIYSFKFNNIYTKDLPLPFFDKIEDRSLNDTGQIILNIKIELYPGRHDNQYKCKRSIDNILVYESYLDMINNDLSNVIFNRQPSGYNPVLTDDNNVIYKHNIDFIVSGNLILTKLKKRLYLTFCQIYNKNVINKVVDDNFGTFEIQSGNPVFNNNSLEIENTCVLKNYSIKTLINKTVYIVIKSSLDTSLSLSDSYTNILLNNNNFYICNTTLPYYETAHIILDKDITYVFTCVITPTEIKVYNNTDIIPKNGEYYSNELKSFLVLTISHCSLFAINIYDEIHTTNKILYNVSLLQNEYNL